MPFPKQLGLFSPLELLSLLRREGPLVGRMPVQSEPPSLRSFNPELLRERYQSSLPLPVDVSAPNFPLDKLTAETAPALPDWVLNSVKSPVNPLTPLEQELSGPRTMVPFGPQRQEGLRQTPFDWFPAHPDVAQRTTLTPLERLVEGTAPLPEPLDLPQNPVLANFPRSARKLNERLALESDIDQRLLEQGGGVDVDVPRDPGSILAGDVPDQSIRTGVPQVPPELTPEGLGQDVDILRLIRQVIDRGRDPDNPSLGPADVDKLLGELAETARRQGPERALEDAWQAAELHGGEKLGRYTTDESVLKGESDFQNIQNNAFDRVGRNEVDSPLIGVNERDSRAMKKFLRAMGVDSIAELEGAQARYGIRGAMKKQEAKPPDVRTGAIYEPRQAFASQGAASLQDIKAGTRNTIVAPLSEVGRPKKGASLYLIDPESGERVYTTVRRSKVVKNPQTGEENVQIEFEPVPAEAPRSKEADLQDAVTESFVRGLHPGMQDRLKNYGRVLRGWDPKVFGERSFKFKNVEGKEESRKAINDDILGFQNPKTGEVIVFHTPSKQAIILKKDKAEKYLRSFKRGRERGQLDEVTDLKNYDFSKLKVISGGQTGADEAALLAAKELGLETGGWAPWGFRTERGPNPKLKDLGLLEHKSSDYRGRTRQNVEDADATVIFGNTDSAGSKATIAMVRAAKKPYLLNPTADELRAFLRENNVKVLNVAGNRASHNPEVGGKVQQVLREVYGKKS